jgi:hypothetical protein
MKQKKLFDAFVWALVAALVIRLVELLLGLC